MLLERRKIVFHGFKYLSYDKGQIHTGIISKETQSNIILRNALPLSLSSLIIDILYLRNLKRGMSAKLYELAPYMYIYESGIEVPYDFKFVLCVCYVNFSMWMKEKA